MTIDKPGVGSLPGLRRLWQQAFGDSAEFIDGFFRTGFSRERCRCAETEGQVAAALYWFDCLWQDRKIAYIYAVATEKDFRGKGVCRALMEDTHRHLQALGYAGAVLVPSEEGLFALYGGFGYRSFCPMKTLDITPGEEKASVRVIRAEEYAKLRAERLPRGGIVQEGDTLSFLASYAGFYVAETGLFCAAREGDTLYFQEYLGDPEALPGIVAALDGKRAKVRLPGGDKPFAMYRSFTEDGQLPSYLGIALD